MGNHKLAWELIDETGFPEELIVNGSLDRLLPYIPRLKGVLMINFLNLEYFLAAAEELNITRAAKRLYISQQSLSNHISNLEKEFDVQLFNRTTPLTLTYAGRALKQRAKQLLELKDETYRQLADIKDFTTGQISIGVSHTTGTFHSFLRFCRSIAKISEH